MTERTTVSRAFGENTCNVTTETGRTSAKTVQFQDCNYQPQCYIEAQKLVFNQHFIHFITPGRTQAPRTPKLIPSSGPQNGFSTRPVSRPSKLANGGTCTYVCKRNKFCNVSFKANGFYNGKTKGACFDYQNIHDCEGTPRFCNDCDSKCRGRVGATFTEIVNPEKECLKKNTTGPLPCSCRFDRQRGDCVCACA